MMFEGWLNYVAGGMGITTNQAGILMSFILTSAFMLVIAVGIRGRGAGAGVLGGGVLGILFFTFLGWFPLWTSTIIALLGTIYFIKTLVEDVL